MTESQGQELLKDRRVVEEIQRHLWIESEKAGYDIGFEQAAQDWLNQFSKAWMDYNLPKHKTTSIKTKSVVKDSPSRTRTKAKKA